MGRKRQAPEIIIIVVVVVMLFGATQLPKLARSKSTLYNTFLARTRWTRYTIYPSPLTILVTC